MTFDDIPDLRFEKFDRKGLVGEIGKPFSWWLRKKWDNEEQAP